MGEKGPPWVQSNTLQRFLSHLLDLSTHYSLLVSSFVLKQSKFLISNLKISNSNENISIVFNESPKEFLYNLMYQRSDR